MWEIRALLQLVYSRDICTKKKVTHPHIFWYSCFYLCPNNCRFIHVSIQCQKFNWQPFFSLHKKKTWKYMSYLVCLLPYFTYYLYALHTLQQMQIIFVPLQWHQCTGNLYWSYQKYKKNLALLISMSRVDLRLTAVKLGKIHYFGRKMACAVKWIFSGQNPCKWPWKSSYRKLLIWSQHFWPLQKIHFYFLFPGF